MPSKREYDARKNRKPADARLFDDKQAVQFQRSDCRGCGRPIVWATNRAIEPESGKPRNSTIPLDPLAHVYAVRMQNHSTVCLPARAYVQDRAARLQVTNEAIAAIIDMIAAKEQTDPGSIPPGIVQAAKLLGDRRCPLDDDVAFYVSHFNTCRDANQFGKGRQ